MIQSLELIRATRDAHNTMNLHADPHLAEQAIPRDLRGLALEDQLRRLDADDVHYTPEDKAMIRRGLERLGKQ